MWHRSPSVPGQIPFPKTREEDPGELYIKILSRDGPPERINAWAYFLGKQPDHVKAMEMAKRLGNDPDPYFRCLGVVALAQLQDQGLREAERALISLTADPDERVRATIPHELKYQDTPETAAILLRLAQDPSKLVRSHVARDIHVFAHPEAKACYLRFLGDPEPSVRAAAVVNYHPYADGLKEPWPEVFALREDPSEEVRTLIPGWLQELPDEEGIPLLLEMSRDPSPDVRASAVTYLRSTQVPAILSRLLECLNDPDEYVRIEAVQNLLRWQGEEVTQALLKCARDGNSTVRKFAAQGLEYRAAESMLPVFERLAEDEANMFTRLATARALGKVRGPESELILSAMLKDPAKLVQKTVRKILEKWSKENPVDRKTELALRHRPKGAKATRDAFNLASKKPMQEWERFVTRSQTLDGVLNGDTDHGPVVVITGEGGRTLGMLPFGPAHWIRIEYSPSQAGLPQLSYAISSSEEVGEFFIASKVGPVRKGRRIVELYGWR